MLYHRKKLAEYTPVLKLCLEKHVFEHNDVAWFNMLFNSYLQFLIEILKYVLLSTYMICDNCLSQKCAGTGLLDFFKGKSVVLRVKTHVF